MAARPDIRRACAADFPAVMQINQLTWPDEEIRLSQVEKVLHDPAHDVFMVEMQGQAAGFIDGFITRSAQGELRWEVDLLAVHPGWRGRQLGQHLIRACLQAGQERGAGFARALIQVENRASQTSFARSGFDCQPEILSLYIASAEEGISPSVESAGHVLVVNTLHYFGLWLEEDQRSASLSAARAACWQANCELVGTLVIQSDLSDNKKMSELGFTKVNDYHWWVRSFKTDA